MSGDSEPYSGGTREIRCHNILAKFVALSSTRLSA
jgi:hypothetical protein